MGIKIGFLAPYSSFYPFLTRNIVDGFCAALPPQMIKDQSFKIVTEYINTGSAGKVEEAANKLLYYEHVDVLSGLVNYRVMDKIIAGIEHTKKLGFFFDMGENIPGILQHSDSIYFNSHHLWQSEYALGYWAHKEFGDKGVVLMSLYDAGYHLHSSFRQGAISAGSQVMDYTVLHGDPRQSQVTPHIQSFFEKIRTDLPSYLHPIFCGSEAIDFFKAFHESGLKDKVPLIITAHMASEDILAQVKQLGFKMYGPSMYSYDAGTQVNKAFKEQYENFANEKANIPAMMGYEMGSIFRELYPYMVQNNWMKVKELLKTETVKSPRGMRNFFHGSEQSLMQMDIEKIETGNNIGRVIVSQGKSLMFSDTAFQEIVNETVTGWQNPYLCV